VNCHNTGRDGSYTGSSGLNIAYICLPVRHGSYTGCSGLNVVYICLPGRHGSYTGSSGLNVVYLSGVEQSNAESETDKTSKTSFTAAEVNDLRRSLGADGKFQGIDLLLTSEWPQGIDKYSIAVVS